MKSFVFTSLFSVVCLLLTACQTLPRSDEKIKPTKIETLKSSARVTSEVLEFRDLPMIGTECLGGFSGLLFDGIDANTGDWHFTTTTDRGPNLEEIKGSNNESFRPFREPGFAVQWFRFSVRMKDKAIVPNGRVELRRPDGEKFSGLPNILPGNAPGGGDEIPTDLKGVRLKVDPMGIDTESLARDPDGSVWMGEEYRPSVLHFNSAGRMLSRWIPDGSAPGLGTPTLPGQLLNRRLNRGFEGLAIWQDSLYAFLQTGLKGDDDVSRIYRVDRASGRATGIYIYPFEVTPVGWTKVDKIGDAVADGRGGFYVIEQNGSTKQDAFRRIYRVEIADATNLINQREGVYTAKSLCGAERVSERPEACVIGVKKTLVADLTELGLADSDKAEGIARIDDRTLAVVNDNDFTERKARLVIIHLPAGPEASPGY